MSPASAAHTFVVCLLAAYAVPVALVATGRAGWPVAFPVLTAPLAVALFRRLRREDGVALNAVLGATAGLLLLFGGAFTIGLVIAR